MASKVEEALAAVMREFPSAWDLDTGQPVPLAPVRYKAVLDALIAAVREEERELCVERALRPSNRYTFSGNTMSGYDQGEYLRAKETAEAIRNAD